MSSYRVIALPDAIADQVRATGAAPTYGHPTHTEVATGHGPCRQCLRTFEVGKERRILFTYDAFHGMEALPLPGPVFIHAARCERYPEDAGFPRELTQHALTFNAYGRGRKLRAQEHLAAGADVEAAIARLLARTDVDYIHVRDTEAGCFDFAIVRHGSATSGSAPGDRAVSSIA
jgi:hypothetical protein